jgi:GH43 family beta-xylosidase
VDYAIADHVLGPYSGAGGENGPRILKTVPGKVVGPGHNSIVDGPDGSSEYIAYHAWDIGRQARRLCIDPLVWDAGVPRCPGPSWSARPTPFAPAS